MVPRNWDKRLRRRNVFAERRGNLSFAIVVPLFLFISTLPGCTRASGSNSDSEWSGSQWIFVIPLLMCVWGFYRVRKAKLVADLPRIPIRSVALGMVTIQGKVEPDQLVPAPVSGRPCCFFKVDIEEWDKDDKHWTLALTDFDGPRFFLADGTGKVLIDAHYVESLEFDPPQTAKREVDSDAPAPVTDPTAPTDDAVLQYVSTKTAFTHFSQGAAALEAPEPPKGRYRLTEWLVLPGQQYQVTGTCAENPDSRNADDLIVIRQGERESTFIISSKTGTVLATDLSAFGWGLIMAGSLYFVVWVLIICLSD